MSTKAIIISVVVVLIVALGGYFIYTSMAKPTSYQANNQTSDQQAQDQVQGQEVMVGTGKEATPGSKVSVLYAGRLQDGTVFDSSAAHGNEPLVFVLGEQGLIPGFQIGVNGMKEGGERLLAIPPSLAYGSQEIKDANGKVIIPANSTLIFNVRLVKVEPAPAATSTE